MNDTDDFSRQLVNIFPAVMRGVLRRQTDALTKGKLTAPQFFVLDFIFTNGPAKMTRLAKEFSVSLPAMSGLVERLCRMKLTSRNYDPRDRRIINITLSAAGKKIVANFRQQRESIIAEIFGQLPEKDRREYLRIILKIKDILDAQKAEKDRN